MPGEEIYAKKIAGQAVCQTLADHVEDGVAALAIYLRRRRGEIERFCSNFNLEYSIFCHILYLALFLHDAGKATEEFQADLKGETLSTRVSHTFFGLPLARTTLPAEYDLLVRSLVLTHHTQPYDWLYLNPELLPQIHYLIDGINSFLNHYDEFYLTYLSDLFTLQFRPVPPDPDRLKEGGTRQSIIEEIFRLKEGLHRLVPRTRTKGIYCAAINIIKHCDRESSRFFYEGISLKKTREAAVGVSPEPESHFIPIARHRSLEITVVPPPGRDDPAQLLALAEKHDRIVWVTPGRHASVKRWRQLQQLTGPERVTLVEPLSYFAHPLYLTTRTTPADNSVFKNNSPDSKSITFEYPLTVTTLDHVVFSMVHGYPQADYALGNLLHAAVVFDRVPAPGTRAAGYFTELRQILRDLKVPQVVVSDLPPPESDSGKTIFNLQDFKASRFYVFHRPHPLVAGEEDYTRLYHRGARQLIITGTAWEALCIYNRLRTVLPDKDLLLYHEYFTRGHRYGSGASKEYRLRELAQKQEPWILTATPAVLEIAEIPADVLHTAPVPPVVLAGYAATLFSYGGSSEPAVYIHAPEPFNRADLTLPEGPATYLDLHDVSLRERCRQPKTNLREVMERCTVFGHSPIEVRYSGITNMIELWEYRELLADAVPASLIKSGPTPDDIIKLPLFWYHSYPHLLHSSGNFKDPVLLCQLPYDRETGIDMKQIAKRDWV